MTVDEKRTRRKNLSFRPKGENPLHDEAVRIMEQFGRGMCDLVAAAVVYYTYQLSVGNVEAEFARALNTNRSQTKVLLVQNPLSVAPVAKKGGAEKLGKGKRCDDIPPAEFKPADEPPDTQGDGEMLAHPKLEPQAEVSIALSDIQGSLPEGLLDSLVSGFGKGTKA